MQIVYCQHQITSNKNYIDLYSCQIALVLTVLKLFDNCTGQYNFYYLLNLMWTVNYKLGGDWHGGVMITLAYVCRVLQLYCAQWLGHNDIVCGGTSNNLVRVVNRNTMEVCCWHVTYCRS